MTDPNPVVDVAAALLSCLNTAVSTTSRVPQHIRYVVGTEALHDMDLVGDVCCEGLAYVATTSTYPLSSALPEVDVARQSTSPCPPPMWAQQFRLGIVTCAPVGTDTRGPTDAEWNAAALLDMEYSWALRRALCCFRAWLDVQTGAMLGMRVLSERQEIVGPLGGCVERYVPLSVEIPNCDCSS